MLAPRQVLLKKYVRDIRNLIISTPSTISPDDTIDTLLAKLLRIRGVVMSLSLMRITSLSALYG